MCKLKWTCSQHIMATPDIVNVVVRELCRSKACFQKNLPLHVAASEYYIAKVNGKYKLKTKTRWYYQIQGELAATCLKNADLIVYTDKGILVIEVQFNVKFLTVMLKNIDRFLHWLHDS